MGGQARKLLRSLRELAGVTGDGVCADERPVYRQCLKACFEVLVRPHARRRGTGKRVRRPVSVAFAEYLEAIAALTGSPFRWGRWRGSWLQAGTVSNAGVLGCAGSALSLPMTFARAIPYASSVTGFLAHLMAL